ncbi:MAG: LamG domain-containing protein [Candidatus Marinimicrobia bacterium]|nr:LamG domain-containing protein [Candidatus Neomarinimicrobiota bacterium]
MASNYRFFPKLIISLVFISMIILFIRRAEYLEKYNDFISEAVDTVAVDTLAQIPEIVKPESKDFSGGLLAYYPFAGDAKDASNKKNDGKVLGAMLTTDRYNLPYNAYRFEKPKQKIVLPKSPSFKSIKNRVSVTAWVKLDGSFGHRTIASGGGNWVFSITNLQPVITLRDVRHSTTIKSDNEITVGTWCFIAFSYSGNYINIYFDGKKLFGKYTNISMLKNIDKSPFIGTKHDGSSFSIDEVYIYDKALNSSEISALYQMGRTSDI